MNADTAARIARKAEQAMSYLTAVKSGAATLAADENTTGETWGAFALKVAEAEGAASAWARLAQFVAHRGDEATEADIKGVAFDMMVNGADDTWSGRGNDIKRARFDGIRSASSDMQWL